MKDHIDNRCLRLAEGLSDISEPGRPKEFTLVSKDHHYIRLALQRKLSHGNLSPKQRLSREFELMVIDALVGHRGVITQEDLQRFPRKFWHRVPLDAIPLSLRGVIIDARNEETYRYTHLMMTRYRRKLVATAAA